LVALAGGGLSALSATWGGTTLGWAGEARLGGVPRCELNIFPPNETDHHGYWLLSLDVWTLKSKVHPLGRSRRYASLILHFAQLESAQIIDLNFDFLRLKMSTIVGLERIRGEVLDTYGES